MADAAQRTKPESAEVRVRTVIPGQTIIVLHSGACLAGQLIPMSVKRRRNEHHADGSPVYDIVWDLRVAKLPDTGLPNPVTGAPNPPVPGEPEAAE